MSSLNSMMGKQSNTYIYNGESYVSRLTNSEISKDTITKRLWNLQQLLIEKLKYIFMDIGDRLF